MVHHQNRKMLTSCFFERKKSSDLNRTKKKNHSPKVTDQAKYPDYHCFIVQTLTCHASQNGEVKSSQPTEPLKNVNTKGEVKSSQPTEQLKNVNTKAKRNA